MEHILVATDGSEKADRAVNLAVDMASGLSASVTALCVRPPRPGYAVEVEGLDRPYRQGLEHAREAASDANVPFSEEERMGEPAEEIVKAADDLDADLVVVGLTGKKGISRLMMGSVAEKVVKESPVPVTVAK
ncbi:MAG: Universal stress protein [Methanonatronarchaeales archaeon]|nr:Universal stress protein [Methanonatronarchaeales archaeon]